MIQVNNLQKIYNGTTVLNLEELSIAKGEVFGLVGNNGAGKTTFFSLVLDLIRANKGEVVINGIQVSKTEDWKELVAAYIDESFTIGYLTPDEYFEFIGELRGMNTKDVSNFLEAYTDFFKDEILGKKKFIRDLSKGNQKKVGVVGALLGNPEVIVLDEPFANLDPSSQYQLRNIIKEYSKQKEKTLLISSHDLDHVADVCSRIVILDKGEVVRDVEKTESTLADLEEFFTGVRKEESLAD
ncbi:ABC transporter ATP-binding protein [Draconibacterium sp. IB214405]|uniref:ABC transporter ATP-binding protein n=1 Tax=Draconibacterium sp. IB214405 TaxID=3097352 RepID=UPI002A1554D1|nr:ABC transporter ATP-binding protein [Draconibacterium sp. IB214405]MDX8341394.1 ABC transporter ATP-binding protein [Draconibacterium sp. IB214405]